MYSIEEFFHLTILYNYITLICDILFINTNKIIYVSCFMLKVINSITVILYRIDNIYHTKIKTSIQIFSIEFKCTELKNMSSHFKILWFFVNLSVLKYSGLEMMFTLKMPLIIKLCKIDINWDFNKSMTQWGLSLKYNGNKKIKQVLHPWLV